MLADVVEVDVVRHPARNERHQFGDEIVFDGYNIACWGGVSYLGGTRKAWWVACTPRPVEPACGEWVFLQLGRPQPAEEA